MPRQHAPPPGRVAGRIVAHDARQCARIGPGERTRPRTEGFILSSASGSAGKGEPSVRRKGRPRGALIRPAATGFLLTRAHVYRDIQAFHDLPACNTQFGNPLVPYFLPLIVDDGQGPWYLGEDFAFCHRARAAGHSIMADTRLRLWHIGKCRYGWEDAGSDRSRFASYRFDVT